jgi:hypothetical protein
VRMVSEGINTNVRNLCVSICKGRQNILIFAQ